jgi:hypothetical protein
MDHQTLRDWVIHFNERVPDGLINITPPGVTPKLDGGAQCLSPFSPESWRRAPAVHGGGAQASMRSDDARPYGSRNTGSTSCTRRATRVHTFRSFG